jgi:Amt family ammonium transporter
VKSCVTTFMASMAWGCVGMIQSYGMNDKKMDVLTVVNGILGGLVGITAGCAVVNVYESLFIGAVGSFLANISAPLLNWLKVNLHILSNTYCF